MAGYKINLQSSTSFPHINNKHSENVIHGNMPIHYIFRREREKKKMEQFPGINLTKEVKGLYNEKFNFLRNEWGKWRKSLENGKTSHAHGLLELLLWNRSSCKKAVYRFNAFSVKLCMSDRKKPLNFIWKHKRHE